MARKPPNGDICDMWRHVAGRRDSMICLFLWVLQLGGVNGLWLMAPIARFGRGFRGPASRRAEVSSGKYRATWWHHRCRGILRNPSGAIPSWQSQGPFDENRPKCFKLFETQKMIHLGRDYIILYIHVYVRLVLWLTIFLEGYVSKWWWFTHCFEAGNLSRFIPEVGSEGQFHRKALYLMTLYMKPFLPKKIRQMKK